MRQEVEEAARGDQRDPRGALRHRFDEQRARGSDDEVAVDEEEVRQLRAGRSSAGRRPPARRSPPATGSVADASCPSAVAASRFHSSTRVTRVDCSRPASLTSRTSFQEGVGSHGPSKAKAKSPPRVATRSSRSERPCSDSKSASSRECRRARAVRVVRFDQSEEIVEHRRRLLEDAADREVRVGRDEVERADRGRLGEPGGHPPALLTEGQVGAILRSPPAALRLSRIRNSASTSPRRSSTSWGRDLRPPPCHRRAARRPGDDRARSTPTSHSAPPP